MEKSDSKKESIVQAAKTNISPPCNFIDKETQEKKIQKKKKKSAVNLQFLKTIFG